MINKIIPLFGKRRGGGITPETRFVLEVKTDNAGTSGSNQFTIPINAGFTYNYDIETSDGQFITGITGTYTITFPIAGIYEVRISGLFPLIFFAGGGDCLKVLDTKSFGTYPNGNNNQIFAFKGCSNMDISSLNVGTFETVVVFRESWMNCSSITSFPLINTEIGTDFRSSWRNNSSLISFPLINPISGTLFINCWDSCSGLVSFPPINFASATNISGAWQSCTNLTSFPIINTPLVSNFSFSWNVCSSLTSFPLIDVSSGTSFIATWANCVSLNTFPSNFFDGCSAISFTNAFVNTGLSQTSIDGILVSINSNGTSGGTFNQSGGSAPSVTGQAAITAMRSRGWTVTVTGGF